MNKVRIFFIVPVFVLGLSVALPAAEMSKKSAHGKAGMGHHEMKQGKGSEMGRHGGHGKGHVFGTGWKETLSDSQKKQVDIMHLAVKKSTVVLKANLNLKKSELNNLLTTDGPDMKAIHRKIDEMLELKRDIMRIKYGHKVEMRAMLTPEQRVSFDMGLLKGGHSKGRSHH